MCLPNIDVSKTKELELHVNGLYEKIKASAEKDDIYIPLEYEFTDKPQKRFSPIWVYTDGNKYFMCEMSDRGGVAKSTFNKLFDVSFFVISNHVMNMACFYEQKCKKTQRDPRRIRFAKYLQLMELVGEDYYVTAKNEIDDIVRSYPYNDNY